MPSAGAGVPKGPAIYFVPATGKAVELLCRFSRLVYYFAAISLKKFIFPPKETLRRWPADLRNFVWIASFSARGGGGSDIPWRFGLPGKRGERSLHVLRFFISPPPPPPPPPSPNPSSPFWTFTEKLTPPEKGKKKRPLLRHTESRTKIDGLRAE